jgi:hypothetical protein
MMKNINEKLNSIVGNGFDGSLIHSIEDNVATTLYADIITLFYSKIYIRLGNQLYGRVDECLHDKIMIEVVRGYEKGLKRF